MEDIEMEETDMDIQTIRETPTGQHVSKKILREEVEEAICACP